MKRYCVCFSEEEFHAVRVLLEKEVSKLINLELLALEFHCDCEVERLSAFDKLVQNLSSAEDAFKTPCLIQEEPF